MRHHLAGRIAFLAAAIGGSVLVYGGVQGLSYDRAHGYGDPAVALLLAAALSHPFWLGALLHRSPRPWARIVRWIAGLELAGVLYALYPEAVFYVIDEALLSMQGNRHWSWINCILPAVLLAFAAGAVTLLLPELAWGVELLWRGDVEAWREAEKTQQS